MNKQDTINVFFEGADLMEKKNMDYASVIDNISTTGLMGVAVRLVDKVSRLYNLSKGVDNKVKEESIRDTLIDIMNYGNIGVQLVDGTWLDRDDKKPTLDKLLAEIGSKYQVGGDGEID